MNRFTLCMVNDQLHGDVDLTKKIFSHEAHFHLGGYINKQNCCIGSSEKSHVILFIGIYWVNEKLRNDVDLTKKKKNLFR